MRTQALYGAPSQTAEVEIMLGQLVVIPATILNASLVGLQLQLNLSKDLYIGTPVKVTVANEFVVYGDVRYCRASEDGSRVGVLVHDVFFTNTETSDHLGEDQLTRYIGSNDVSPYEMLRAGRHLVDCAGCADLLAACAA